MNAGSAVRPSKRSTAFDEHVGARIRQLRELRGLTQSGLGQGLGVSFQQLQKYERAGNRISAGRLFEVARILNVEIGYFFEGLDDKTPSGAGPPQRDDASELFAQIWSIEDSRVRKRLLDLIAALAPVGLQRARKRSRRARAKRVR
jgi:transcriptional regulator with XRE-family HTH domain